MNKEINFMLMVAEMRAAQRKFQGPQNSAREALENWARQTMMETCVDLCLTQNLPEPREWR